ncbi:MAG: hypothetical protein U9N11_03390 [Campylobacterota bacterium]|nr:hypothetical protein [Campylobacterota bacterium]
MLDNNAMREVIYIFLWLIGIIFMYALLHTYILEPSSSNEKSQIHTLENTIDNVKTTPNDKNREKVTPPKKVDTYKISSKKHDADIASKSNTKNTEKKMNTTIVKVEDTTVVIPIQIEKKNTILSSKVKETTENKILPNIPSLPTLPKVSSVPKAPTLPSVPLVTVPVSVENIDTDTFIKVLEKDDDKLLNSAREHMENSIKIMNDTITQ